MVNTKKNYIGPVYEKTLFSIIPQEKVTQQVLKSVLYFFFLAVNECALFYVLTSELLEKAEVATLYHCADRVQVGVESHCLPFH